jgi:gas vesicle protein
MNSKRSRPAQEPASTPSASYGEMPRPMSDEDRDDASTIGADIKQTARRAGQAIREQASTFASEIGHELSKNVEDQKRRGLEAVRSFAGAVNTAAQELEQQSPQVARYVRDAAEGLQSLTRNIEGRNLNDLVRSATDLARSNPTLFMMGAVAAGFALARFMKSSTPSEELGQQSYDSGYTGTELAQEAEIAYGSP